MLNLNSSNFKAHPFHLVSPSPWPLYTSISLLSLTTSAVLSFHGFAYTEYNFMLIDYLRMLKDKGAPGLEWALQVQHMFWVCFQKKNNVLWMY